MLNIKSAQWGEKQEHRDFINVDVRRLHGMLLEYQHATKSALEKMKQLLVERKYDITPQEIQALLSYELGQLNLSV